MKGREMEGGREGKGGERKASLWQSLKYGEGRLYVCV